MDFGAALLLAAAFGMCAVLCLLGYVKKRTRGLLIVGLAALALTMAAVALGVMRL